VCGAGGAVVVGVAVVVDVATGTVMGKTPLKCY